jgi:hypothetical protein
MSNVECVKLNAPRFLYLFMSDLVSRYLRLRLSILQLL